MLEESFQSHAGISVTYAFARMQIYVYLWTNRFGSIQGKANLSQTIDSCCCIIWTIQFSGLVLNADYDDIQNNGNIAFSIEPMHIRDTSSKDLMNYNDSFMYFLGYRNLKHACEAVNASHP